MSSEYKELVNQYKYAEIPEEPRYKKKKKPAAIKRSNHKHVYKPCLFKYTNWNNLKIKDTYGGEYCIICGRIKDHIRGFTIGGNIINDNIPTFNIDDIFQKYVDLGD